MRRVVYASCGIAALAFVLSRYWYGSTREPRNAPSTPSAAEANAASTPASAVTTAAAPITPSGIDAGEALAAQRAEFIQRLHVLETTNPRLASSLALEDRERVPNSPDADERDAITVAALHNQRDIDGASREAWYYFVHHPNGKFTKYLSELTRISPPTTRPKR